MNHFLYLQKEKENIDISVKFINKYGFIKINFKFILTLIYESFFIFLQEK